MRWLLPALLLCTAAVAQTPPVVLDPPKLAPTVPLDQARRADGAVLVPDRFLRRWDSLTLFLNQDVGPAQPAPEDQPGRIVTLDPPQPGSWLWINPRTLHFKPAEPWPAAGEVTVSLGARRERLTVLMPAPVSSQPADGVTQVASPREVILSFADPVDPALLARLLTVEIRPLPGLDAAQGRSLTAQDFTIKPLDRSRDGTADYALQFRAPIEDGAKVIVRLRQALDSGLDAPVSSLNFSTAQPFRATGLACGRGYDGAAGDDALACQPTRYRETEAGPISPALRLSFSAPLPALDPVQTANLLRLSPPVDGLTAVPDGPNALLLRGAFRPDTLYDLHLGDAGVTDTDGRPLDLAGLTRWRVFFSPERPVLAWEKSQGIAERLGPQMVPIRARGVEKVDLRIHPIDPLARSFWPFPNGPVEIDETVEPPLDGLAPAAHREVTPITAEHLAARLSALGTPSISEIIPLPGKRGGGLARLGIDLQPYLARIAGPERPGTYLVGLRRTDGPGVRSWMRLQVTDLSLSAVEEAGAVRFFVTSLATAQPVAGARVRLEGGEGRQEQAYLDATTDTLGAVTWRAPGGKTRPWYRLTVTKGEDRLVLHPGLVLPRYAGQTWNNTVSGWLDWTLQPLEPRQEKPRVLCHIFTERPIYRPEDPVQVKGFVRSYLGGAHRFATGGGTLVIQGPNDEEWRVPVTLSDTGSFHYAFAEKTVATGEYSAVFESAGKAPESCGRMTFKKDAYRLPTFEVLLNGPQRAPLDEAFGVDLTARYFAGGLVADRPITWRVTQAPIAWTPPDRPGFFFSSDSRFGAEEKFRASPVLEQTARTDEGGGASITLNPTLEPTGHPRRYQIEATVTGPDDIQVRTSTQVQALPAFVLGVKVPRYLESATSLKPEIIAIGPQGTPVAGVGLTVKLIKRSWNSLLQAGDFSQGTAKYTTETIDEVIEERKITSADDALTLEFPVREAGVYLVQAEAADKIGRRQAVSVDLFVNGGTPVTWSRPPTETVTVSTDKDRYDPGETAQLVLQSPFQTARALAIVEEPEGPFRYEWLDIQKGRGSFTLPIRKTQMPRVAVHFLVMRGRLPGEAPAPTAQFDLRKPATLAASKWLTVTPVAHQITASFTYPEKARPGQTIDVVLKLRDEAGKPLAGEATFWLIDQAVLSLAKEQPLDPLPQFIVPREMQMAARDSRNLAFGLLPLMETPGGDKPMDDLGVDNIAVRKNFTPVPIYLPTVPIGPNGEVTIPVTLPDSLTVFKLRAKAISGPDRFGYATGELPVRLPVIAQPALPRFVRPGDTFDASVIGRVVEGEVGAGKATLKADGLTLSGAAEQSFTWEANRPQRLDYPVAVGQHTYRPDGSLDRSAVRLGFTVQRLADQAGDAVEISLPLRPDRPATRRQQLLTLAPGQTLEIPAVADPARPGTLRRSLLLASDPALPRVIAGMVHLVEAPWGCTEQRISLARVELALKPIADKLGEAALLARLSRDVRQTIDTIDRSTDERGLAAFWPGTQGNVTLTAWALQFLIEAREGGEAVDLALLERLATALKRALRAPGDDQRLGEAAWAERAQALAALAQAGSLETGYLAELARRARTLGPETLAQTVRVLTAARFSDTQVLDGVLAQLWAAVKTRQTPQGLAFDGFVGSGSPAVLLPSETRSLAQMIRAVGTATPNDPRNAMLVRALIDSGQGNGWGNTNTNSEAILALVKNGLQTAAQPARADLTLGSGAGKPLMLAANQLLVRETLLAPDAAKLAAPTGQPALTVTLDESFVPQQPGADAAAGAQGFVVQRDSYRVPPGGGPLQKLAPGSLSLQVGDVIEDVVEVVTAEDRTHVAVRIPLAAGMEPLNPSLATAPAEAKISTKVTSAWSAVSFLDDQVSFFFTDLPRGTYKLALRSRATIPGSFTQPPSEAELMYRTEVRGNSPGARVTVSR
ncbi:hypothetical protein GCM10011497_09000 [Elstera cyanobacteriorum]|uniref:Alpha-2-macroglobulin n=1 Tax=Elstera cyanobacteriorum TaxID=2022747 RepID=A0A255XJ54_9PROT|nr:MG2 domain-containing protein [Elstera cyanobacteriorum]OYQ17013.1 hypothetical protein CHR90_18810 [Elstera cyanobacteriorum]GFZ82723.1 hypothetical protein GCM10011497_09000 [Elstera cyanobacteriorum]